ncbi:MAG: Stp1/IreP family PP2C-type Ser/Thr phosphatase [Solirubrobacterales bacterium]
MLRVAEQAQRTDTGRQRNANEDSFFARAPVFAVADGMGGAKAGEVASKIAADAFDPGNVNEASPEAYLESVANEANREIHDVSATDSTRSGMGTTLTAAMVHGDELSLAHVGDSRAYLIRDGRLRRLTQDHSLVEELRRQGRLTEEQAEQHPQRSIITRALGPEAQVEVDTMTYSARDGDVVVLCSDGLTTMVSEDVILDAVRAESDLRDAVARLVREANESGGRDNITVLAFRLEDSDAPATEDGATVVIPPVGAPDEEPPRRSAAAEGGARRRFRPRTAARILVPVAIVAAIAAGVFFGGRQIYFLGTDEGGRLALFRGLPYELPFGIELYDERYSSPVQVDSLPRDRQQTVRDHSWRSRGDAVDLIADLERTVFAAPEAVSPARDEAGEDPNATEGER